MLLQFGTHFVEMNAEVKVGQTTKGVWLSKSTRIADPTTLVMDLEGADGSERGEDDTNFERQSALFALAMADVLMINVWSHDIGREHGSGKPLLRTILQVSWRPFGSGAAPQAPCRFHQLPGWLGLAFHSGIGVFRVICLSWTPSMLHR